jgi:nicotinate-nucleotide pyrophosphorylase
MAAGHIEGAAEGIVEEGLAVGMEAAEEAGIELAAGIDLVLLDNTRPPRLHAVVDCTPLFFVVPSA